MKPNQTRPRSVIYKNLRFSIWMCFMMCGICTLASGATAENQVVDRIVAVVNQDIIVLQDLEEIMTPLRRELAKSGQPPEQASALLYEKRKQVLESLIDQKLMLQSTGKYDLNVDDKEVDAAIERMKAANKLTDESLREALLQQGITIEKFRESFREQILLGRIEHLEVRSRVLITEADVKAEYERNAEKYGGKPQYKLRHLMKRPNDLMDESNRQTTYAKMVEAREKLNEGVPFADVVAAYADPEFSEAGGELGVFALDDLAPALKAEVDKLSPGQCTPIIDMGQGFQIIFLEKIIQGSGTPFEKVADDIEKELKQKAITQKRQEWLKGLRSHAHIKITN